MKKLLLVLVPVVLIAFLLGRLSVRPPATGTAVKASRAAPVAKQLYTCSMHPQVLRDHPGDCPICGMRLVAVKNQAAGPDRSGAPPAKSPPKGRRVLYWRAPMDPGYVSDKPGKSPMGMDLVPVYSDEISSDEIQVSPTVVQNIGVTTAPVTRGRLDASIRTYGTATWDETSLAAMNTKVDGWIEKLDVNETGQIVRKGQPLVSIYAPKLVATEQEYLSALDAGRRLAESRDADVAAGGRQLIEAARRRLKLWDITDAQIAELERTREVRKTFTLYAPIRGIVTERSVVLGDHVQAGQNLVKIASLDPVWVLGALYEEDIPLVTKGLRASVTFDSLPGETFEGVVDYVYPFVQGQSRTAQVRIKLPNPEGRILPQMYATVRLRVPVTSDGLLIPSDAVIRASSTDTIVFLAQGDGRFAGRKVVLGPEGDGGTVLVKAGLEPGDRVVTSAQFLLDSESNLKSAIAEMLSQEEPEASR